MTFDAINKTPYLPNTKRFPRDLDQFIEEVDKTYVDIANSSNAKTIGLYPINKSAITGNQYFLGGNNNPQSLRRLYIIPNGGGNINHNLDLTQIQAFVSIIGTFTDGTNWYPLPHVDNTNANNQISVTITSTQIQITPGAALPPTISGGYIVLEYITN